MYIIHKVQEVVIIYIAWIINIRNGSIYHILSIHIIMMQYLSASMMSIAWSFHFVFIMYPVLINVTAIVP